MTKISFAVYLVILALFAQPMVIIGQTSSDWVTLKTLPAGSEIRVETKVGKLFDGTLTAVSETAISISSNGKPESIDSADVKKVFQARAGSRGRAAAIGSAIGAGIGTGLGVALLAATGGSDSTGAVIAPFIAIGAGVGAALGAVFPGKKRKLIFEAK